MGICLYIYIYVINDICHNSHPQLASKKNGEFHTSAFWDWAIISPPRILAFDPLVLTFTVCELETKAQSKSWIFFSMKNMVLFYFFP